MLTHMLCADFQLLLTSLVTGRSKVGISVALFMVKHIVQGRAVFNHWLVVSRCLSWASLRAWVLMPPCRTCPDRTTITSQHVWVRIFYIAVIKHFLSFVFIHTIWLHLSDLWPFVISGIPYFSAAEHFPLHPRELWARDGVCIKNSDPDTPAVDCWCQVCWFY